MSDARTCPGCGRAKTRRARLCRDCRRRAIDVGVVLVRGDASVGQLRPERAAIPAESRPITPGKRDAFHTKCYLLSLRRGCTKADVKNETMAAISREFGRAVTSANDLLEHEARWALDRLEQLLDEGQAADDVLCDCGSSDPNHTCPLD